MNPITFLFILSLSSFVFFTTAAPLEQPGLDQAFRGLFDRIIDYLIEISPLNDLVHHNYDGLYHLFLSNLQEAVLTITKNLETTGTPVDLLSILGNLSAPILQNSSL